MRLLAVVGVKNVNHYSLGLIVLCCAGFVIHENFRKFLTHFQSGTHFRFFPEALPKILSLEVVGSVFQVK